MEKDDKKLTAYSQTLDLVLLPWRWTTTIVALSLLNTMNMLGKLGRDALTYNGKKGEKSSINPISPLKTQSVLWPPVPDEITTKPFLERLDSARKSDQVMERK